jgi:hypothetical protein
MQVDGTVGFQQKLTKNDLHAGLVLIVSGKARPETMLEDEEELELDWHLSWRLKKLFNEAKFSKHLTPLSAWLVFIQCSKEEKLRVCDPTS